MSESKKVQNMRADFYKFHKISCIHERKIKYMW